MNFNLTLIFQLLTIVILIIPIIILAWGIYKKKSTKKIIGYTILSSIVIGVIVQSTDEGHAHVPFSEFMLFLGEVGVTVILVTIVLGIRYIYAKYKNT